VTRISDPTRRRRPRARPRHSKSAAASWDTCSRDSHAYLGTAHDGPVMRGFGDWRSPGNRGVVYAGWGLALSPLSGRRRGLGRVTLSGMSFVPPARHLLRAKDLADARYSERLDVDDLARAAGLSRAHFSRQFRRAFGASPHAYLLTRRLERAAALLRATDRSVADVCFSVGLQSVGSFTTSFTRTFGISPTMYRARFPPAADYALVPACVVRLYARPQRSTFREDSGAGRD
jgi:AraC-like DNA-binding protein